MLNNERIKEGERRDVGGLPCMGNTRKIYPFSLIEMSVSPAQKFPFSTGIFNF